MLQATRYPGRVMLLLASITTLLTLAIWTLGGPVIWEDLSRADAVMTETTPVTIIPWPGSARIPGAFLISRISLNFINDTCTRYSSDLDAAIQLAKTLANTRFTGSTTNQLNRYGYTFLKLENDLLNVLNYIYDLVLCSGRGSELWTKYYSFKTEASVIWTMLKKSGVKERSTIDNNSTRRLSNQSDVIIVEPIGNTSLTPNGHTLRKYLSLERPSPKAQQRNPLLFGLGHGLIGSYVFSAIFNTGNKGDIDTL